MTGFELFNWIHLSTILTIFLVVCVILSLSQFNWYKLHHMWLGWLIVLVLILHSIYLFGYLFYIGQFSLVNNLPFHLCSISSYLIILTILTKNSILTKVTFFLTLTGTILALIMPNLTSNDGFGSFGYTEFFVSHSFIIFGFCYLWSSGQFRLKYRDLWQAYGIMAVYAFFIFTVVNPIFDSNYIYLKEIPQNRSSITFGPPPWHILNMAWILLLVMHFQFWIYKKFYRNIENKSKMVYSDNSLSIQ